MCTDGLKPCLLHNELEKVKTPLLSEEIKNTLSLSNLFSLHMII